MANVFHKDSILGDNHAIHFVEYADEATRLAATGFVAADVGKIAKQTDTSRFWILEDESPIVWHEISDDRQEARIVFTKVFNNTGLTITKGSSVYINGFDVTNQIATVALASNAAGSTMPSQGIVEADILDQATGRVCQSGPLSGLDTSAFSVADKLWTGNTAGTIVNLVPTGSDHVQVLGYVLKVGVGDGIIGVSWMHGEPGDNTVDHAGVILTAGIGLSGGGDITVSRTFDLDINELTEDATASSSADFLAYHDTGEGTANKIAPEDLNLGSVDKHDDVDTTTAAPSVNDRLGYNGTNWVPVTPDVATIAVTEVSATATTTTTSATYVAIGSMTSTPAAGDYLVNFSSSGHGVDRAQVINFAIFVAGVIVQHSDRSSQEILGANHAHEPRQNWATQAKVTVNGSEAIDIRWLTSSSTATMFERSMELTQA